MLQYVVLRHEIIDQPHFDFMYETSAGSMLQTWRLAQWPVHEPQEATRIRDHRRAYLQFQGDIGAGRGAVVRVDEGTCTLETSSANRIAVILNGPAPQRLVFEPDRASGDDSRWIMRREPLPASS